MSKKPDKINSETLEDSANKGSIQKAKDKKIKNGRQQGKIRTLKVIISAFLFTTQLLTFFDCFILFFFFFNRLFYSFKLKY